MFNAALLAQINARRSGGATAPQEPSGGNQTPAPSNSPADTTRCGGGEEPSDGNQKPVPLDFVADTKHRGEATEPSTVNQQPSRINLFAEIARRGKATEPIDGDKQQTAAVVERTETPQTPSTDNEELEEKRAVVDTESSAQIDTYKRMVRFGLSHETLLHKMAGDRIDIALLDEVFGQEDAKNYRQQYEKLTTSPEPSPVTASPKVVWRKYHIPMVIMSTDAQRLAAQNGEPLIWTADCDYDTKKQLSDESFAEMTPYFIKRIVSPGFLRTARKASASTTGNALIEGGRAHIISITLFKLPSTSKEWCQCVANLNFKDSPQENLKNFLETWPNDDDMRAVKDFNGDSTELGKVDKLFVQLRVVPNLKKKLQFVHLRAVHSTRLEDLRQSMLNFERCVNQILENRTLRAVLQTIVSIHKVVIKGNNVDQDAVDSIVGLRVSALAQFATERTEDPETPLIRVLVRIIEREYPRLGTHLHDLTLLRNWRIESVDKIRSDCESFRADCDKIIQEANEADVELEAANSHTADPSLDLDVVVSYFGNMQLFAQQAELESEDVLEKMTKVDELRHRFYAYFVEPEETPFSDVIYNIAVFVEAYIAEQTKIHAPAGAPTKRFATSAA